MKTIIRVAKTELRFLFYSPIAWFLMIVFLIQCGVVYVGVLESIVKQQELGGRANFLSALTLRVFLSPGSLFGNVMQNLYLYIPLLTMGLISRETSGGTIKLLYSSPMDVSEIVFGKFLAMVVYSLLLVAIVAIFVVSGMFHIQLPDTGMLLTALLGFFLLLCAYASIGLFMSSLTTYQVVAAICTFVMIGVLSYIGSLWQDIEFVRGLTYFLSINGRTSKMLSGMVTTKDVLYFILIVYIFLGLTIYKMKAGTESKPALLKAARYVAVVVSALLIGYISSIPRFVGYYDATANKSGTLTPQVQKIIAELGDEPLEITAYNNLMGRYWSFGAPKSYNTNLARWEPYMRFKDNIKLNTVYYYDSVLDNSLMMMSGKDKTLKEQAENYAKSMDVDLAMFKTPEEIRKIIDLRPELNRYVMQLKWKDRITFLRIFNDQQVWPGETEVAAALKRLLQAKLPKVAFLTGDLERNIDKKGDKEYQTLTKLTTFRHALVNQGFDVDTVSLETQEIPADVSTLVLADPKIALTPVTMEKIKQYIARGGNMLITCEPGRQAVMNPLLKELGVQMMNGMVVQASKDFSPDLVTPGVTPAAAGFTKPLAKQVANNMKVSMPGASGLSYIPGGPFKVQPLLVTDSATTWNRIKKLDLELMTSATAGETGDEVAGIGKPRRITGAPVAVDGKTVVMTTLSGGEIKSTTISLPKAGAHTSTDTGVKTTGVVRMATTGAPGTAGRHMIKLDSASVQKLRMRISAMPVAAGGTAPDSTAMAGRRGRMVTTGGPVRLHGPVVRPRQQAGTPAMVTQEGAPLSRHRRADMGTVAFSPADGDTKGAIPIAISLARQVNGKEQRIVVTGDADFMCNAELQRMNMRTANFNFNTALFSWLAYSAFPIDASRPDPKDNKLYLTGKDVKVLRIVYIWILPALLLAFGTILLIRRKRK
jgi:ABC-2 type transport system permease protein